MVLSQEALQAAAPTPGPSASHVYTVKGYSKRFFKWTKKPDQALRFAERAASVEGNFNGVLLVVETLNKVVEDDPLPHVACKAIWVSFEDAKAIYATGATLVHFTIQMDTNAPPVQILPQSIEALALVLASWDYSLKWETY